MEFVQILERYEENGVKKARWSKRYRLHVGFKESWVLDKTTDTAYVKFHYHDYDTPKSGKYCTKPTWGIMDWCRILHVKDENDPVRYNADGTPDNFSEYVIGDIQANYIGKLFEWIINIKLEEPIVRAYGVLGETLTFTNQTTKTVDGNTYTREPYNHLTALERWLKLTPANCDNYDAGYDKNQNISWYNRIRISDEDKEFLREIPFADDTFNELNLYNVLLDNYDSSTGRTPAFYFDLDPATDLPRNPARDEYLLTFLRQDGADKGYIDTEEFFKRMTAYQFAKSLSNYATGLASNVQNISSNKAIAFPSQKLYAAPEVDTTGRDVTGYTTEGSDDWFIRTPFKIKKVTAIKKIQMCSHRYNDSGPGGTKYYAKAEKQDIISSNILEEKEYLAADTDLSKEKDIFWYQEGGNRIYVKEYRYRAKDSLKYGQPNSALFVPLYYVEYEPYVDARVAVGDGSFVQQINQTSSQVDNVKYNKYMQSYLDGMNVPDLMVCKACRSFDEFKDYLGKRIIIDDVEYLVTNVGYQNRNFIYDAVFQLNENHFRKNDSVRAPQTIRSSIAIATDNIKQRQINYKQTVKVGLSPVNNSVSFDKKLLIGGLIPNYTAEQPQVAVLELKYKGGSNKKLVVPITVFSFGNQVNISIAPFDNAIIGYNKIADERDEQWGTARYHYYVTTYTQQIPTLYTDAWGEVERLDCKFATAKDVDELVEIDANGYTNEKGAKAAGNAFKTLLNINNEDVLNILENNVIMTITNQQIQKDMMEKMSVNHAFAVVGKDCIVCDELIRQSKLFTSDTSGNIKLAFSQRPLSLTDEINGLTNINVSTVTPYADNITYSFSGAPTEYSSVAIVKNNKFLLIFNKLDENIKSQIRNGNIKIYY